MAAGAVRFRPKSSRPSSAISRRSTRRAPISGVLETQRRQGPWRQSIVSGRSWGRRSSILSYTKIYASENRPPSPTRRSRSATSLSPRQVLLSTVPKQALRHGRTTRGRKLTEVRPGQPVDDPHRRFSRNGTFTVTSDSIQRGNRPRNLHCSRRRNATGNFVKVVQRVPVKVCLMTPRRPFRWISPGMSVETSIEVAGPWWLAFIE